jgi:hypothetical protein
MPLTDDDLDAFESPPTTWRPVPDRRSLTLADLKPRPDEVAPLPMRLVRSFLIGIVLLILLVVGALGLGYALSSWLGHGKFLAPAEVAKSEQIPVVPESLAPTGAVGPPRLTVQESPPPVPLQTMVAPPAAVIGSTDGSAPAAEQAVAEAASAGTELSKLLRRARWCMDEQDYDCAVESARSALKLEQKNGAARKLLRDAKAAQDSVPAEASVVMSKDLNKDVLKEVPTTAESQDSP